jgi:S1-C subfamily serine protease
LLIALPLSFVQIVFRNGRIPGGQVTTALGSAFLVAPRTLVTNAHVVDTGTPVLVIGLARVPVKIVRKDEINDLAVLSVDMDLTSATALVGCRPGVARQ